MITKALEDDDDGALDSLDIAVGWSTNHHLEGVGGTGKGCNDIVQGRHVTQVRTPTERAVAAEENV